MWTFVGHKRHKFWLWLAVERASRRVVARKRRAGAMQLRPAASGPPCPSAAAVMAGMLRTCFRPTPRRCHPARIGPAPRAKAKPTSWER
ncbi:hypothetical protein H8B14_18570 [Hymenobacter sp. BT190]|nr:hypothetical protein [Hymenobacter sp. BT190]